MPRVFAFAVIPFLACGGGVVSTGGTTSGSGTGGASTGGGGGATTSSSGTHCATLPANPTTCPPASLTPQQGQACAQDGLSCAYYATDPNGCPDQATGQVFVCESPSGGGLPTWVLVGA
jgi:hypothetical protein